MPLTDKTPMHAHARSLKTLGGARTSLSVPSARNRKSLMRMQLQQTMAPGLKPWPPPPQLLLPPHLPLDFKTMVRFSI